MIGTNIKNLRLDKKITQDELARNLNVTRQAVSKWECNKAEPDIDLICKIAEAFDTTVEELLCGATPNTNNDSVHIINVTQENYPAVRLIGKRYNGNVHFRAKWREWHENDWFPVLEKSGGHLESSKPYIGAKRIVNGALEYWIGMLFLPGTVVPTGFEFIEIDAVSYAVFRLYGKVTEAASFETHCLCLDELPKYGLVRYEDHWCIERYSSTDLILPDVDKIKIIDYGVSIMR